MTIYSKFQKFAKFVMVIIVFSLACQAVTLPFQNMDREEKLTFKDEYALDPDGTVSALNNPEQIDIGIWSILAKLGIGVYTVEGDQILAGSETVEDDFWLYDFVISALARMHT